MSFTTLFHSFDIPQRAGLARQLLLAGATLLLAGSTFAQTPAKSEKAPRILTVTDSVQLVGRDQRYPLASPKASTTNCASLPVHTAERAVIPNGSKGDAAHQS